MKINVTQAKNEIGSRHMFKFVTSAEQLGIGDEHPWTDNDINVEGQVVNTGRALEVTGAINAVACYQCDRCLDEFCTNVEIAFNEEFLEGNSSDDSEEDISYFQGDEIDLSELVRENILLAQPISTVCKEECLGLCIKCGNNLNQSECSCDRHIVDPRLAELQKFFNKD